ncbi:MAG: 4-(cytidine 5'-diphospho)-2-C-methyl-D-erythritol kinase [Casimicrobiaceae bacterium]
MRTATPLRLLVPAPAKLNLFLHVTGRQADGYHTLESLFVGIDLCDWITLDAGADSIRREGEVPGVAERDDLAVKAAHALRAHAGIARGVAITVAKHIPIGAGLGGGSSDAASVLLGLNRLWGLGLDRAELAKVGAKLGADVPFFLGVGPALARGIGDELRPVTVPHAWFALVIPPVHVATASIFSSPELTRCTPSAKIDVFSESYGRNDLQAVAAARFPVIAAALSALADAGGAARMTGSGGSVFAPFVSRELAQRAVAATLPRVPDARGCVTRVLAQHPLAGFA